MPAVTVVITDGPLAPSEAHPARTDAGAVVVFDGVVRAIEDGRTITGLRYETYDPMAHRVLESLANQALEEYGLKEVHVLHSRGQVGAGDCSFRLTIASPHRREALDAMNWFIDRMKQDAPIWKTPVHADAPTQPVPERASS